MVYICRCLGGSCSGVVWTVAMSWSQRSSGRRPAALSRHDECQAVSTWTSLPQVYLLETPWWRRRSARGADMWAQKSSEPLEAAEEFVF